MAGVAVGSGCITVRVTVVSAAQLTATGRAAVRGARLAELLRGCGTAMGVQAHASFAVRLTDDAEMSKLNASFAGIDKPTDVLAFPGEERAHVGDIAISVERALAQAAAGDGGARTDSGAGAAELRLLAVHGLLHCLGHDHMAPEQAAQMTAATRRLLPEQPVPDLVTHSEPGHA